MCTVRRWRAGMKFRWWRFVLVVILALPTILGAPFLTAARSVESDLTSSVPSPVTLEQASALACTTGGPASDLYSARLCLTTPDNGATLDGRIRVKATVEIDGGTAPPIEYLQFF